MKKGDRASLYMKKHLLAGGKTDKTIYRGSVLKYDEQNELLYLVLDSGKLTQISLDAIYECEIENESKQIKCSGRVKERYFGGVKILKLHVENGFYKINIKYVDKQKS